MAARDENRMPAGPAADPVLRAFGAAMTYPDGTRALSGVDLEVREGEFVTLIGPSGCGKSTLLRMVAGLATPTGGRIEWSKPPGRRRAFVFQDPTLMPWARVAANVRLPLDLARVPRAEAERRVARELELVGLSRFERHYPHQLSGGMQMRASIARALVAEPSVLLMDEPFGALDEITRNRMDEELLALRERQGFTALFVTHSIYEAVFLSTRVLVMSAHPGRLFEELQLEEPYPRSESYRVSPQFVARCRRLSEHLARASEWTEAEA